MGSPSGQLEGLSTHSNLWVLQSFMNKKWRWHTRQMFTRENKKVEAFFMAKGDFILKILGMTGTSGELEALLPGVTGKVCPDATDESAGSSGMFCLDPASSTSAGKTTPLCGGSAQDLLA